MNNIEGQDEVGSSPGLLYAMPGHHVYIAPTTTACILDMASCEFISPQNFKHEMGPESINNH
jgi:hypothetical protein